MNHVLRYSLKSKINNSFINTVCCGLLELYYYNDIFEITRRFWGLIELLYTFSKIEMTLDIVNIIVLVKLTTLMLQIVASKLLKSFELVFASKNYVYHNIFSYTTWREKCDTAPGRIGLVRLRRGTDDYECHCFNIECACGVRGTSIIRVNADVLRDNRSKFHINGFRRAGAAR